MGHYLKKICYLTVVCISIFIIKNYECYASPKNNTIEQPATNADCSKLKNFQCQKCETLVRKDKSPTSGGCPKGGNHNWKDLGTVGNDSYLCKKCSTLVKSKAIPTSYGCPNGGNHSWKKL